MKRVFTDVACSPFAQVAVASSGRRGSARALFLQTLELCAATLLLLAPSAARGADFEVYLRAEQFGWEEFLEGEQLLQEDGSRLGGGFRSVMEEFNNWSLALRLEGTAGQVDYDGQTFGGDPVSAKTDYVGLRLDLDAPIGPRPAGPFGVQGIAGIGTRYWIRRLAEGRVDAGGYDEFWWIVYGRLGLSMEWTPRPSFTLFVRAAARPPIHNRIDLKIDLVDEESFSLEPGGEWTEEIEAGIRWNMLTISAFYETLFFEQSPVKVFPPVEVFQPRSEGEIIGLQVGLTW